MIAAQGPALPVRFAPMHADLDALQAVLLVLEDGAPASRELDAAIFEALGWLVTREHVVDPRQSWTALSPLSNTPLPLPRPTKRLDHAKDLVPFQWEWAVGVRSDSGPFAWCGRSIEGGRRHGAVARTPALALTQAALRGQRAVVTAQAEIGADAPCQALRCDCGWEGTEPALRVGRCPDCSRLVRGREAVRA